MSVNPAGMKLLLCLVLLAVSAAPAQAQVLITEVQSNTVTMDEPDEWLELHNTGATAVDVGGWQLHDYAGAPTGRIYTFPAGAMLGADQVVIIAKDAAAFTTLATTSGYAVTVPDYELATDLVESPAVPDLTAGPSGTHFGLGNSGDAVRLLDATGAAVDAVEWGNTNRAEIPGNPAPNPTEGQSLCRTRITGDNAFDFERCAPTPGTGFVVVPTPPAITNATRAPANLQYGATFTISSTVSDGDGVAGVELYLATATSSSGPAAASYTALAANHTGGSNYRAGGVIQNLVAFPAPTGFSDRYVRYFLYALDNQANEAELPAGAITGAENTAYFWENVLPANTVFPLAEVRAQGANEVPIWEGHSVRFEGIALTDREAFIGGATNFFVAAEAGVDAIRVFDDVLIGTGVSPGDRVRVTGKIGVFRGVRQVGRDERPGQPAVAGAEVEVTVLGTGTVPMRTLDIASLLANGEQNESQLVELAGVMLVPNPTTGEAVPATWAGNTTLYVSDGSGTLPVRVAAFVDLADTPTPTGTFDLRGIFTQFAPSGTGGYQLQPRSRMDVIGGGPPVDAGVMDAGAEMDGGEPGMDAAARDGSALDSGVSSPDATAGGDGGTRDAGFFGTERDEGCGCHAAGPVASGWSAFIGVLLLGLLFLRRRP